MDSSYFRALFVFFVGGCFGIIFSNILTFESSDSFANDSKYYLLDNKIDLPEEISILEDQNSNKVDLLSAYINKREKIIYISFTGVVIDKDKLQKFQENNDVEEEEIIHFTASQ